MADAFRREHSCDATSSSRQMCGVPPEDMAKLLNLARTIGTSVRALRVDAARGI